MFQQPSDEEKEIKRTINILENLDNSPNTLRNQNIDLKPFFDSFHKMNSESNENIGNFNSVHSESFEQSEKINHSTQTPPKTLPSFFQTMKRMNE